ncbi:USP20_3 [Blepharisma stoltei]|uniref:Ubiquitinyl hydrolase 1 n=1 Tax=Blepharisma stoltei TaxID=1481888 RepID=A0AAU9KAD1_9CILI|nr:unnamed protein product [Blepharisma stoltei]
MSCPHLREVDEKVQYLNQGKSDAADVLDRLECKYNNCGAGAPDVWRCLYTSPSLTCHIEVCSRDRERHAREPGHTLFFNISTLTSYCFECKSESREITLSRMFKVIAESLGYDKSNPNKKNKRITGMKNLGNTCYVSTVLQCISRMLPIQTYLRKDQVLNQILDDSQSNTLIYQFREILKAMWSGHIVISPDKFIKLIPSLNPDYAERKQRDAQEFLLLFFDNLRTYLQEKTGKRSIISEATEGIMVTEFRCHNCGFERKKEDNFGNISLAIPQDKKEIARLAQRSEAWLEDQDRAYYLSKKGSFWKKLSSDQIVNLYDCLLLFFSPQDLVDPFCEGCRIKHPCAQQCRIKEFPDILIINLNRASSSGSKISKDVITPFTLKLDEFSEGGSPVYNLSCLIEHDSAAMLKGHYLAYFRDFDNGGKWYECDDKYVKECSEEKVREAQTYIAIYTKFPVKRPKIIESESADIYIPKEWVNRYYSLSNPGPINFNKYYCSHSFLSADIQENELIGITNWQWEELKGDVGFKGEPIVSKNPCGQCLEAKRRLDERINFESALYNRVKNGSNGFPRFFIPKPWIKSWESFLTRKSSIEAPNPPGQIRNNQYFFYENGSMKDGLRSGEDYVDVNQEIWLILNQAYSSDMAIIRINGDIYSDNAEKDELVHIDDDTEELISRLFSL